MEKNSRRSPSTKKHCFNHRLNKQVGFEANGVCPVCGPNARERALSYARQRAGYGRAEIQVLDKTGKVFETIGNEDLRPLVRRRIGSV